MDITVYNYLDQSLADSIAARVAERATSERLAAEAAKKAEAAGNTASGSSSSGSTEDFATVLRRISQGEINAAGETGATASRLYSTEEMEPIFEEAARTYGVSVDLLKAIGKTESAFNASAVSSAGAVGVMQLMPATAAYLGVTDSYDARQNIMGGAKYISQLLEKYNGSVSLALAAYNAGSNNVDQYGGIPPFTETQNYVRKVLSYFAESVSAPSAAVSTISDQRSQVNSALEAYFTSKNISRESLELFTTLLETKRSIEETNASEGISTEAAAIVLPEIVNASAEGESSDADVSIGEAISTETSVPEDTETV